jgi:hypothetical protein
VQILWAGGRNGNEKMAEQQKWREAMEEGQIKMEILLMGHLGSKK